MNSYNRPDTKKDNNFMHKKVLGGYCNLEDEDQK